MFQTGQKVVCINDTWATWVLSLYKNLPVKGSVYTIRDVGIGRVMPNAPRKEDNKIIMDGGDEEITVTLVEIVNPPDPFHIDHQELGFNSNRFAPIEKTKTEEHYHQYAKV